MEQIPDLLADFDWAMNEECYTYNECGLLAPFVNAGKAVFAAHYKSTQQAAFCAYANGAGFSGLVLPVALDGSSRFDCLSLLSSP